MSLVFCVFPAMFEDIVNNLKQSMELQFVTYFGITDCCQGGEKEEFMLCLLAQWL